MGVKDLCPFLRTRNERHQTLRGIFDDFTKTTPNVIPTIGIDVSIFLIVKLTSLQEARDQFFALPKQASTVIAGQFKELIAAITSIGFRVVLVFDGCRHPLKYAEHDRRYKDTNNLKEKLQHIYNGEEDATFAEIDNIHKKLVRQRVDVLYYICNVAKSSFPTDRVKCVGSPFEADDQLVALQNQGLIDFILSNDSDLFVRGGKNVIMQFSLFAKQTDPDNSGEGQDQGSGGAVNDESCPKRKKLKVHTCSCSLVNQRHALKVSLPTQMATLNYYPKMSMTTVKHIANFLGNDFIDRVHGNTVSKLKSAFLPSIIESGVGCNKNDPPRGNKTMTPRPTRE